MVFPFLFLIPNQFFTLSLISYLFKTQSKEKFLLIAIEITVIELSPKKIFYSHQSVKILL
jgi:hypothetical protein